MLRLKLRTALHGLRQLGALPIAEFRRVARRLAVDQSVRAFCIEALYSVPNNLTPDPAHLCRFCPATAIIDHRQRQQPAGLVRIPTQPREPLLIDRFVVSFVSAVSRS